MSRENGSTLSIGVPWFLIFVIVKLVGTAFAHWSWWWVLLPIVPDLAVILQKAGLL